MNVATDAAGSQIELVEYKPFGEFFRHDQSGTSNAAWAYFTGKQQDDETGLIYFGARYYSPLIGRFLTPDSLVQAPSNPQTLNRYSYCNNNPVNLVDADGHFWFIPLLIAAVKGAIVGALTGGAIAAVTGGNITQGLITGAIGGAIFGMAGNIIKPEWSMLGKALTHAAAGAISGSLGALATGGDVGQGALIGGISAGAAKFIGSKFNLPGGNSKNVHIKFASDFIKQALIGAAIGGTTSAAMGGNFGDGARNGAIAAGVGFIANDSLHEGGYLKNMLGKGMDALNSLRSRTSVSLNVDVANAAGVALSGQLSIKNNCVYGYLGVGIGTPGEAISLTKVPIISASSFDLISSGEPSGFIVRTSSTFAPDSGGIGGIFETVNSFSGYEVTASVGLAQGREANVTIGVGGRIYCFK